MSSDFNNRMDAQREFLKIINARTWASEPLFGLSQGAIDRWSAANQLTQSDRIVALVKRAGEALYFLANKSQEQVSPEYRRASNDFTAIIEEARSEIAC
jgi:hypothetical protein